MRSFLALLMLATSASGLSATSPRPGDDWADYLGGPERNHYSALDQINRANVSQLRVAWEYHTGDPGQMQCNPIVVRGVLYGLTASNAVFALDAASGRELWRYSARTGPARRSVLRGIALWRDGEDERVLFTFDSWLYALDARTGQPLPSFGENGCASLKAGLGSQAQDKWVVSTTPGAVFEDLIIVPLRVTEGADAAPGFVQAFSVRTGKLVWTFRTIPEPGEFGYETWSAEAYKNTRVGGANSWAGMAVDVKRGVVYVPTGSAAPDFWGGDRRGDNLFANCLIALDARTGQRKWHYQFVRHDLWDRDLPAPPNLVSVERNGQRVEAVAQVTKTGHVFVFDRVTGESLFPIDEVPAARSDLNGEYAHPTQRVPRLPAPFARQTLGHDDISPFAPDRTALLEIFQRAKKGPFQPLSVHQDTIVFPGFDGGAEWGGAAVDPDGTLYVNANEMAWVARLRSAMTGEELAHLSPGHRVYASYCSPCHTPARTGNAAAGIASLVDLPARRSREEVLGIISAGKGMMPGFATLRPTDKQRVIDFLFGTEKVEGHEAEASTDPAARSGSVGTRSAETPPAPSPYQLDGYVRFVDSAGYPAITPPWGTLTAINLSTGERRWQVTLGEVKELTAKGVPPTGVENYGGPVVTAGGLLFIAATKDGMIRAFDKNSGTLLWEHPLPAPGFATPCTYRVGGKQFVVVAAGGSKLGTNAADSYVAFALP